MNNLLTKYIEEYEEVVLAMKPNLCNTKWSASEAWVERVYVGRAALK